MREIIAKDEGIKSYQDLMKAEIVTIQDTGLRYRCDFIKYRGKSDGRFWINKVRISQGVIVKE